MGGKSGSGLRGYEYYFGIHMGISRGPVDELIEIKVGDKTAWRGSVTGNQSFEVNAYNLFGGADGEGGVRGTVTALFGGDTQTAPSLMNRVIRFPAPGFRRKFTLFFDGMICAINPYPKPWKTRQRRFLAGWEGAPWYPERALIRLFRPITSAEMRNGDETTTVETVTQTETFTLQNAPDGNGETSFVLRNAIGDLTATNSFEYFDSTTGQWIALLFDVDWSNSLANTEDPSGKTYRLINPAITPGSLVRPVDYRVTYSMNVTVSVPGPGAETIGAIHAMNPVHILYECVTNREWGRGLPRDRLNDANWRAAADQIAIEGFGLCLRWKRKDTIESFMQSVLNHISASIYENRTDGRLEINLARANYVRENVPLFTFGTGLLSITEATVAATAPKVNEVQVSYRDPITNEMRKVEARNLAALQAANGEINTVSLNYEGIPTAELAMLAARRELKSLSTDLRRFSITLDRRGSQIVPGGVIRIQDPSRGINDLVVRIGTVDYGSSSRGEIRAMVVQDVFALPSRNFTTIGPPQWAPPQTRACVAEHRVFEAPYRSVYRRLSAADFAQVDDTSAFLAVVSEQGQPMNLGYRIAVKPGAINPTEIPSGSQYFCGYTPN